MEWLRRTGSFKHFIQCIGMIAVGLPLLATADHFSNSNCEECHSAGSQVDPSNAHLLTASQETLCGGCHKNALLVSHPTGFTPEQLLPAEYPLDWQGSFTCSTCHSIHGSSPDLLRNDATGQSLCLSCHEAAFFSQMADNGLSLTRTHLTLQPIDLSFPVDTYSLHCTGCHEDSASLPGHDGFDNTINTGDNHMIGIDYVNAFGQGRYYDITELNEHMVLPYGFVSCVTCHQGYSSHHGILTIANTASSLCYQCHDL